MANLDKGLVVGRMGYHWISMMPRMTRTMKMTAVLLCQLLHLVHHLRHLWYWDLKGLSLLRLRTDLLENATQVSKDSYEWPAMMKRTSKCSFSSRSLHFFFTKTSAPHDISRK